MSLDSQKDALREGEGGTRPKLKTDRKILEELTNVTAHKGLMKNPSPLFLPNRNSLTWKRLRLASAGKNLNNSKRTKKEEEL